MGAVRREYVQHLSEIRAKTRVQVLQMEKASAEGWVQKREEVQVCVCFFSFRISFPPGGSGGWCFLVVSCRFLSHSFF